MLRTLSIAFALLIIFGYSAQSQDDNQKEAVYTIGNTIADAYGFKEFDTITELQYTFNAKLGDKTVKRSWIWHPQDNKVTLVSVGDEVKNVSYVTSDVAKDADSLKEVDSWFINDQYWLVFPFHLVWDEGIKIDVAGQAENLPIGSGMTTKVIVTYPDTGGYTPGDVYELYVNDDNMIVEWVYRRGGSKEPTRMSTWEDNTQLGPITISLDHNGPDGFRVWFTDVIVQTK